MSSDISKIKYPTEKNVASYFKERSIRFEYEFPVAVKDEEGNLRIWYPDFFLLDLGLFVEVCGSEIDKDEKYRRERIYKENGISVVFLHYWKDEERWKSFLWTEVNSIERGRVYDSKKLKPSKQQ